MPRGKTQKVLARIDAAREILARIQPASIRAVAYQLFIQQLIPSMKKTATNAVSADLVFARERGIVPWEWVVDETRDAERPGTWESPETFIPAVMRSYRRDRWQYQACRVEVWSEKGTIRGTLSPLLQAYGITFRVTHGHSSATAVHEVCSEYQGNACPLTVLYVGDHDPSGLHMSEVDLPERLPRYGGEGIHLTRLGITPDDLPALPGFSAMTKRADTRYPWFAARYGDKCVELDALSPVELRRRVEAAIVAQIDRDAWERCAKVEAAEQHSLQTVLDTWHDVKTGLAQT